MTTSTGVLIVGAGPVGLVAAACLSREGIPVTIVEANPELPDDLRASTFHPPTLDMLDDLGVAQRCIEQGLICHQWQFRDRHDGLIGEFDLGLLAGETRHPFRLQCEQWKLARILRSDLERDANVTILYGASALDVRQDEENVRLSIQRPDGGQETIEARYLIGADGARSQVRRSIGVEFEGFTIPELYLTLTTPFRFENIFEGLANIAYISDPDEWFVLLRTPTLWRVLFPAPADEPEEIMLSNARVQERLQGVHAQSGEYDVAHATAYRVHERVAKNYVCGRVFLAGDAAHLNNPLGGMGMNGGIHDAVNLCGKLTAVWRGAPVDLMGRYERQRRKVAIETVQAQALRNRRALNERDPDARRAQHEEIRRIVADTEAHRAYVRRSSLIQSLREAEAVV